MKIVDSNDFYVKELGFRIKFLKDENGKIIYYNNKHKDYLDSKNLRLLTKDEINSFIEKLNIKNKKLYYDNLLISEENGYFYNNNKNEIDNFLIRFNQVKPCYIQICMSDLVIGSVENDNLFKFITLVTNK